MSYDIAQRRIDVEKTSCINGAMTPYYNHNNAFGFRLLFTVSRAPALRKLENVPVVMNTGG